MIPQNRIRDCWDLVFEGETEHFASANPIEAALRVVWEERVNTGKRVLIVPMPERN
jgi:hypothetical protein